MLMLMAMSGTPLLTKSYMEGRGGGGAEEPLQSDIKITYVSKLRIMNRRGLRLCALQAEM